MKRNQLTITYPARDAQDLQQTLQHLKTNQYLNLSAFCRAAIAEKLKRHQKNQSLINQDQNQQQQETFQWKQLPCVFQQ